MERWEKESFHSADFFFVSRSLVCTCKLQKGKEGKKRKKSKSERFHCMQRHGPAETIPCSLIWICCESSAALWEPWGKEGVGDSYQAPCHWWRRRLLYEAVGSPDTGCHLSRLVDGLTVFLMHDEQRKETATPKSAGSWSERLPAHARLNHTCKTTSGKMNCASSPALSPDQTWLRPALFLAAIPLVPNPLLLLFINRMLLTEEA